MGVNYVSLPGSHPCECGSVHGVSMTSSPLHYYLIKCVGLILYVVCVVRWEANDNAEG